MEEQTQIERAKKGDRQALAQLFQQHYSFLLKYLIKFTMNLSYAEELAQETMVKGMEKIHLYNGKASFSSWLIQIGTHLYIDQVRKKKREQKWLEREGIRQLKWTMQRQHAEWPAILEVLQILPEENRIPIVLKHYYGYTHEEIARMLKIPEGTVKSRIHYGLKSLRKEWKGHEG